MRAGECAYLVIGAKKINGGRSEDLGEGRVGETRKKLAHAEIPERIKYQGENVSERQDQSGILYEDEIGRASCRERV